MKAEVEKIHLLAEQWNAEDVLRWAFTSFGQHVEIASGFGVEGMVLLDMAARLQSPLRVFTLDTDFLFPETYALMETVEKRYGITVERLKPALTPEDQEVDYGAQLWRRNPDACCNLRKIEPLRRKLSTLRAWVTSIRRDQTAARANTGKVEWDSKFHLVKINPLADWSLKRIWQYVMEHSVPYNPLHDQNYPSIGCTHCTRSILPGEDPRAGRWSGFNKTECGLHGSSDSATLVPEIAPISADTVSSGLCKLRA